jgi:hypothetical protein
MKQKSKNNSLNNTKSSKFNPNNTTAKSFKNKSNYNTTTGFYNL